MTALWPPAVGGGGAGFECFPLGVIVFYLMVIRKEQGFLSNQGEWGDLLEFPSQAPESLA